jgi:hypothetical protein
MLPVCDMPSDTANVSSSGVDRKYPADTSVWKRPAELTIQYPRLAVEGCAKLRLELDQAGDGDCPNFDRLSLLIAPGHRAPKNFERGSNSNVSGRRLEEIFLSKRARLAPKS